MVNDDTIAAIATAIGEAGIGIIRISGSKAVDIAGRIFIAKSSRDAALTESHKVLYGHIIEPASLNVIDEVLVIVMRGPHSYTREDVVEIHCHGGVVPLRKILSLVIASGARIAEPGEFTKRAFLNGRLDLSQAEAVIDIIRAKTDASLKMAVSHLSGFFSQKVKDLRYKIVALIAQLEAAIDFPEEDIEEYTAQQVKGQVEIIYAEINKILATASSGRILREGLKTVIIGKPNVGKSSLLNTLLGENRAIVTDIPGTTRDIIEESVNIGGIPLVIVDTAGIRDTADIVEKIGVERSRQVMSQADLILVLLDASLSLSFEDEEVLSLLHDRQAIVLVNKTDLPSVINIDEVKRLAADKRVIKISATDGSGIADLEEAIKNMVFKGQISTGENSFVSNVRHVDLLEKANHSLIEVFKTIDHGMPLDCMVIDLRSAWEKLGEISGDTVNEDIVDEIFTRFCIGK